VWYCKKFVAFFNQVLFEKKGKWCNQVNQTTFITPSIQLVTVKKILLV